MIRYYRPLSEIKAITFDLDDTLYDNRPIIKKTEEQVLSFISRHYPKLQHLNIDDFRQIRNDLRLKEPEIYHDVSQWRWRSIEWALLHHGYGYDEAQSGATKAMEQFSLWRSKIDISDSVRETLEALSQKFELAVITNGNANPNLFGIGEHFKFILRSGPDGRAKPYRDMYQEASSRLNLPMSKILHVGDDLITDVMGSFVAGAQACWINDFNRSLIDDPDARVLPHIEISRLDSLKALL
jgi:HAD superfamily hydrolase (TIGR01549 family)